MKVFLTGGKNIQWALVDDFNTTKKALSSFVEFVSLDDAQVIHVTYIEGLREIPPVKLQDKKIICHMIGEPYRYFKTPEYRFAMNMVDLWIAHSIQALNQLIELKMRVMYVPYIIDRSEFYYMSNRTKIDVFMDANRIPQNTYLIGNFHRDTEGKDLITPKYMKGPDIFVEIVTELHHKNNIHIILAGPRRHWIRKELSHRNIPYTFIGNIVSGDDISYNILSKSEMNILYNLIDMYVISSRTEGGPRTLLEAVSANCNVISTPVGIAKDLLKPTYIYSTVLGAVKIIEDDMQLRKNNKKAICSLNGAIDNFTIETARPLLEKTYRELI